MTDQEIAQIGGVMGVVSGMVTTIVILSLAFTVLLIIAHWKIFTKAGEAGWKSLIPIYSDYVLFRIVWTTQDFLIYLGTTILSSVFFSLSGSFSISASGEIVPSPGNTIFMILAAVCAIAALVWFVRLQIKTAMAFGKGVGFAIGLILLPNIFKLILGFGSAEYQGPQD